jgi:nucleoside diphosphate kinase
VDAAKYEPSLYLENVMKLHYQDQVQYSHFHWLIDYMTLGPVVALAIEDGTNDCVNNLRAFIGSCNVPSYFESLRSSTQLSEWVNSAHSNSSRSEALRELSLWNLSSFFSTEDLISSNTICPQEPIHIAILRKIF